MAEGILIFVNNSFPNLLLQLFYKSSFRYKHTTDLAEKYKRVMTQKKRKDHSSSTPAHTQMIMKIVLAFYMNT